MELSEPGGVGVLACELIDGAIVMVDALAQRGEQIDDGLESRSEFLRESLRGDLV